MSSGSLYRPPSLVHGAQGPILLFLSIFFTFSKKVKVSSSEAESACCWGLFSYLKGEPEFSLREGWGETPREKRQIRRDMQQRIQHTPTNQSPLSLRITYSGLEGPVIDEQLADALGSMTPPLLGIRSTAVYLDGILMMYLDEAEMDEGRGLGPYLDVYMGWKANSVLLEKHNNKVFGQDVDHAGRQARYEMSRSLFEG